MPGTASRTFEPWHEDRSPIRLVTVRISVCAEGPLRHIRVEGRLAGDAWPELEQVIGDAPESVCLELAGLRSADAVALAGLRRLRAAGAELRDVPPHLAWRLENLDPPPDEAARRKES
jgi:hypothetical protein